MGARPVKITLTRRLATVGALFLIAAPAILYRASPAQKEIEDSLKDAYKGRTLTLRNFYVGSALEFDPQGAALKSPKVGPWTLYSRILVTDVKLKSQTLEFDAQRLFLHYLTDKKEFEALRDGNVRIRLGLDHEPSTTQDLEGLLGKIFLKSGEHISELVPPYWKQFCSHMSDPEWGLKEAKKVRVPNQTGEAGRTPPLPLYKPEPAYGREARQARINGTLALVAVIDQGGRVADVMLIRPLGMGLDESAVETVRTWKFKPGEFKGNATAVRVVIEVSFHI